MCPVLSCCPCRSLDYNTHHQALKALFSRLTLCPETCSLLLHVKPQCSQKCTLPFSCLSPCDLFCYLLTRPHFACSCDLLRLGLWRAHGQWHLPCFAAAEFFSGWWIFSCFFCLFICDQQTSVSVRQPFLPISLTIVLAVFL